MLTKFVVPYVLTSHWWVFFFILASYMRLSTIRAIIHSYGYGIMFVHPYFCCCSGSDAENACRNRMCLFDQPSTLGAQVRFVLNLKCNTCWFLSGKKNTSSIPDIRSRFVSIWPSNCLYFCLNPVEAVKIGVSRACLITFSLNWLTIG